MPSLEYFLVCRSASIDVHSNELTLSSVLEDVYLDDEGHGYISKAVAVGAWNLSGDDIRLDFQALLRVKVPGQEGEGSDFPVNLVKGRHRLRALISIEGIPIETPGELTFELLLNSKHAARHRVIVHEPGASASDPDNSFANKPPPS